MLQVLTCILAIVYSILCLNEYSIHMFAGSMLLPTYSMIAT